MIIVECNQMMVNSKFPVSTVSVRGCDALPENTVRVTDRIKYGLSRLYLWAFTPTVRRVVQYYAATGAAPVSVLEEGPASTS
jgi:hypothetical protein